MYVRCLLHRVPMCLYIMRAYTTIQLCNCTHRVLKHAYTHTYMHLYMDTNTCTLTLTYIMDKQTGMAVLPIVVRVWKNCDQKPCFFFCFAAFLFYRLLIYLLLITLWTLSSVQRVFI